MRQEDGTRDQYVRFFTEMDQDGNKQIECVVVYSIPAIACLDAWCKTRRLHALCADQYSELILTCLIYSEEKERKLTIQIT